MTTRNWQFLIDKHKETALPNHYFATWKRIFEQQVIIQINPGFNVCFKRNVSEDVNEKRGNVRMLEIP